MCFEGNSASLSSTYLNSQLASLWKNAVTCSDNGDVKANSLDFHKSKYTRALAEYHYIREGVIEYPLTSDLLFHASFLTPHLKFVCNHDAILFLTIKTGHMYVNHDGKANGSAHLRKEDRWVVPYPST